jgi:hypothetical protein
MGGIFYRLTFADDLEPDAFLKELSAKINASPERSKSTRVGGFTRVRVFSSSWNSVDGKNVQRRVQYLFLVQGYMKKVDWLEAILAEYGTVSFPLDDGEWTWSSENDIS